MFRQTTPAAITRRRGPRVMVAVAVVLATSIGSLAPVMEGQSAHVMELSADDVRQAKALFDEKAAIEKQLAGAQKRIDAFRVGVMSRYLVDKTATGNCHFTTVDGRYVSFLEGWNCGDFVFTAGFRFIVPAWEIKPAPPACNVFSFPGGGVFASQAPTIPLQTTPYLVPR